MRQILALVLLATTVTVNAMQPNVVLIMADDMGYEALSVNGSEATTTMDQCVQCARHTQ